MFFKWKDGARERIDANIAGAVCEKLEAEGRLTARNLLDESRPEDAPLHSAFEWDDTVAAERYREDQARGIIRHLVTVREDAPPVRSYFKIEQSLPQYTATETILAVRATRETLLEKALTELEYCRAKYNALVELSGVFEAVDHVREEHHAG